MSGPAPIDVLLVDDSPFVRKALSRVLKQAADIAVVGEAGDGRVALELVRRLSPDVVLLDVAMPVKGGLETLDELRHARPEIPVILVSSATQRGAQLTLEALEKGAFDFVDKSSVETMRLHDLGGELIEKVRAAAASRQRVLEAQPIQGVVSSAPEVLVIGASTGGPSALVTLARELPTSFAAAVVVVQHIPQSFVGALVDRMSQSAALATREAVPGDVIEAGVIHVVKSGKNGELVRRNGRLVLTATTPAPETPHVPSVDALFHSAARTCGARAWGVLLTGMGTDGAHGLLAIRNAGGLTVAQDEASCAVFGMPRAANELGAVGALLPLGRISSYLTQAAQAAEARDEKQSSKGVVQ